MIWCHRDHQPIAGFIINPERHTLPNFLLCCTVQSPLLTHLLVACGFLTADTEGGLLYWRLRFWLPSIHRTYAWAKVLGEIRLSIGR